MVTIRNYELYNLHLNGLELIKFGGEKPRQRMSSTNCSRTTVSFRSIALGPHPSPPCFPEKSNGPVSLAVTFKAVVSLTQDLLWNLDQTGPQMQGVTIYGHERCLQTMWNGNCHI
jgi:hypothetical protein